MKIDTDKLIKAFEDNPIPFMVAAGTALAGFAKVIEATTGIGSRRAYAKMMRQRSPRRPRYYN